MQMSFVRLNHSADRRSLAIFDRKVIAHLGALRLVILRGNGNNRCRNRRESRNFGAFRPVLYLAMGKYGCRKGRLYPKENGAQLGRDPSKNGSSKSPVL